MGEGSADNGFRRQMRGRGMCWRSGPPPSWEGWGEGLCNMCEELDVLKLIVKRLTLAGIPYVYGDRLHRPQLLCDAAHGARH